MSSGDEEATPARLVKAKAKLPPLKGQRTMAKNKLVAKKDEIDINLPDLDIQSGEQETQKYELAIATLEDHLSNFKKKSERLISATTNALDAEDQNESDQLEKLAADDEELISDSTDLLRRLKLDLNHALKRIEERREDERRREERNSHRQTEQDRIDAQERQHEERLSIDKERLELEKKRLDAEEERRMRPNVPELELQEFDGNRLKWKSFYASFSSTIGEQKTMQPVDKLKYLMKHLVGEAKEFVQGHDITNENYQVVVRKLQENYGGEQNIINAHYKELRKLEDVPPNNLVKLIEFRNKIESHLRELESMKVDVEQQFLFAEIFDKLPSGIKIRFGEQKEGDRLTLKRLRKLLHDFIKVREDAGILTEEKERSNGNKGGRGRGRPEDTRKPPTLPYIPRVRNPDQAGEKSLFTTQALTNPSGGQPPGQMRPCAFCEESHLHRDCKKYPDAESRRERVKFLKLCFKCLRSGHQTLECNLRHKACYYCKNSNHNSVLCFKQYGKPRTGNRGGGSDKNPSSGMLTVDKEEEEANGEETVQVVTGDRTVLMQSAKGNLRNPTTEEEKPASILMDSCAGRTYITEELASKLKLKTLMQRHIVVYVFSEKRSKTITSNLVEVEICLKDNTRKKLLANTTRDITGLIRRPSVQLKMQDSQYLFNNLNLADTIPSEETTKVDLLLGNDYFWQFILTEAKMEIPEHPGLFLVASKLGWLLTGSVEDEVDGESVEPMMSVQTYVNQVVHQLNQFEKVEDLMSVQPNCEDFWALETLGIKDSPYLADSDKALESFNKTVEVEPDGRYTMGLPWKTENPELPENWLLALGRLRSLLKRISPNQELVCQYEETLYKQLDTGKVEEVFEDEPPPHPVHYLPHHAVIRPTHETTQMRVVFDGGAKTCQDNLSINECLHRGPNLMVDLTGLQIRFRMEPVGIVGDIEKAFLMLGLKMPDRDATRFLWVKDTSKPVTKDNIRIFRFCRIPFGLICSPFLLQVTLKLHLQSIQSEAADQMLKSIYVDNLVTGASSADKALEIYKSGKKWFADAKMNLRQWSSNSEEMLKSLPTEDVVEKTIVNVLGTQWDTKTDCLLISGSEKLETTGVDTKRKVLQNVAKIFDPMGLFAAVTVRMKLFLQRLWKDKSGWDDPISDQDQREWTRLAEDTKKIGEKPIPRFVGISEDMEPTRQLLCFTDSSGVAFCALIYLRVSSASSSEVKVHLIMAKTRLAPTKAISIPRLELMGVVIGTRLLTFVENQLFQSIESKYLWTDSQCVLSWISNPRGRVLTTFVENRLREIRPHVQSTNIRYVETSENPADLATRGISAEDLEESDLWWHGPSWLKDPVESWPTWDTEEINQEVMDKISSELKKNQTPLETCYTVQDLLSGEGPSEFISAFIKKEHYSKLMKLLRVTAWCLRAKKIWRKETHRSGPLLRSEEIKDAKLFWIKKIQRENYAEEYSLLQSNKTNNTIQQLGLHLDEATGIIRCSGRLGNSDLTKESQCPALIPRKNHFTELVVQYAHEKVIHMKTETTLTHVRKEFWIPHGRTEVRKIIKNCRVCRRWDAGPYKYPKFPPLPRSRVTASSPFSFSGLDYFGPLFVKVENGTKKVWVALFTCFVVRAVHLEVVGDLTAEEFILALRRFISRRGKPQRLTSDNAGCFTLSEKTLKSAWENPFNDPDVQNYVSNENIQWTFIPQLSPWQGGLYERLNGICKKALRKSIGRKALKLQQLTTLLCEIEAVMNSRPLIHIGSDLNDRTVLTPADFLSPIPETGTPVLEDLGDDPNYHDGRMSTADALLETWRRGQKQLNEYWKIWSEEYLQTLRERSQFYLKQGRILEKGAVSVGDVVLIKEDLPRGCWKMGRVSSLNPSQDGEVRSVKVQLCSGNIITRPINLLCPLECPVTTELVNSENQDNGGSSDVDSRNTEDAGQQPAPPPLNNRGRVTRRAAQAAKGKLAQWIKELSK